MRQSVLFSIALLFLPACAGLPASGPTTSQIIKASDARTGRTDYDIIDVDQRVAGIVASSSSASRRGNFKSIPARSSSGIGVGDTIEVTIFESQSGGLFSSAVDGTGAGVARLTLPPQTVDRSGMISVPYAGAIAAAGRTPRQVQRKIEQRLAGRAIEPQAVVTVVNNESRLATVTGDVEKGGRVALPIGTERLLDAIALAGGPRGAPADVMVKLTRHGRSEEMRMSQVVNEPEQNVRVQPGDQIFVYQRPQTFVALGASTINSEVKFNVETLTLSEALGRMGGPDDRRADAAGVFVFRYESARIAEAVGASGGGGATRPVVYRLNLKQPASLLAAQRFPVKDRDVVYLANSPSTELSKFLALLGSGVGTANASTVAAVRVIP